MKTESKMIYIVTSGCYSSYTIRRVFDDYKKAKEYTDKYNKDHPDEKQWGEQYGIEKYIIDSGKNDNKKYYYIIMSTDGNAEKIDEQGDDDGKSLEVVINDDKLHISIKAESEKHAIKIANEIRIGMKIREEI